MTSIRDFVPLSKLGQGSYSTVYKVKRLSDQQIYALKKVRMNNLTTKQKQNALNQIRILASIESQYIVGYKQAFFDQKLNLLCIVMEFADGGDLHKLITDTANNKSSIHETQIWKAIHDILSGLIILHSKGILHRDLKSANIFLHQGKYKLGDLNVSKVNGGNLAYTQTGTPFYASPEVWRDQPYGAKSDIWSFGCIIYQMITLRPPFNGKDMQELYKSVQRKSYSPLPQSCSIQLQELIKLALQKNHKIRKSASQLLNYPRFNKLFPINSQKQQEIKIQTAKNKQLLKTIILPTDLKSLQKSLPNSKYNSEIIKQQQIRQKLEQKLLIEENKYFNKKQNNFLSDRPTSFKNNISLISEIAKKNCYKNNKSQNIFNNYSQINMNNLKSPKNNKKIQNYSTPTRNQSCNQQNYQQFRQNPYIRLSEKKINAQNPIRYSQKITNSDSKRYNKSNLSSNARKIVEQYIQQSQKKKNVNSIPRTQKRTIINNSGIQLDQKKNIQQTYQQIKNKLIKKSRVNSNKYPKPSWWG